MQELDNLFQKNKNWSEQMKASDPEFFSRLSAQQAPEYLWIGCSDSRVPANQVIGLDPGEVFVHRNIANLVVHNDLNFLSVLQYAVEQLKVTHVIVCGHYNCGGVSAAMLDLELGLIENWLRHIQDVRDKHRDQLSQIDDLGQRINRLCELNVMEQVVNVCRTTIVRDAWNRDQALTVHGWIYGLEDGLLRDTQMCVSSRDQVQPTYLAAVESSAKGIA